MREYFIPIIEVFLSSSEIHNAFVNANILHHIAVYGKGYYDRFNYTWNFFSNHTNFEQQKDILSKSVYIECYEDFEIKEMCYVIPKINILQASLIDTFNISDISFLRRLELYQHYFNVTERQDLIINGSKDFIPFLIIQKRLIICKTYALFLKNLFKDNKDKLKDFLLAKLKPTKLNIFDILVSFKDVEGNIDEFKKLINI